MERVQVLIDKLLTQKAANQTPDQLLVTVHLLHQELVRLQGKPNVDGTTRVAVVLPAVFHAKENGSVPLVVATKVEEKQEPLLPVVVIEEPKEEKPMFQQQSFFDDLQESPTASSGKENVAQEIYVLRKPTVEPPQAPKEEIKPQPSTALPFDVIEETPTLSYRQPQKEIHEVIGGQEASLNDKLKQEKTELANVLQDAPIKDLRKGIGVNDKFLFINELFRGDESIYEKSIKTINAFHILPEAEYWINRELKMRLAWNDNKEVVQHFYQLVRRRFS